MVNVILVAAVVVALAAAGGLYFSGNLPFMIFAPGDVHTTEIQFNPLILEPRSGVGCRSTGSPNILKSTTIMHPTGKAIGSIHVEPALSVDPDPGCSGEQQAYISYNVVCVNPGSQTTIASELRAAYDDIFLDCASVIIDATLTAPAYIKPNTRVTIFGSLSVSAGVSEEGVELVPETPEGFPREIINERTVLCAQEYMNCVYEANFCKKLQIKTLGQTVEENCAVKQWNGYTCEGIIGSGKQLSFKCTGYDDEQVVCNPGEVYPWCSPAYPRLSVKGIGLICNNNGVCEQGESCSNCGDCPTPEGMLCCPDGTREPLCMSDADCNDNVQCTDDKCINPNSSTAYCQNEVKPNHIYDPSTKECLTPCPDGSAPNTCSGTTPGFYCQG